MEVAAVNNCACANAGAVPLSSIHPNINAAISLRK
jgi:hypothetical protein